MLSEEPQSGLRKMYVGSCVQDVVELIIDIILSVMQVYEVL